MSKMKNVFDEVLYEKYITEDNKETNLFLFFNTDVRFIRKTEEEETDQNAMYVNKTAGKSPVDEKSIQNIQNIHNLIDYASDMVENGKPLINELVSEVIKLIVDQGTDSLQDMIKEEDKMILDIDYGFSPEDSIGFKLNKTPGSDLVSFTMKKNGNIIAGEFNQEIFEKQLLSFRTRFINKE